MRVTILASGIIALAIATAQGCSDDSTAGTGGASGSSGSSGSSGASGSGGSSAGTGGGSSGTGGGEAGTGGGSAGTGGGEAGTGGGSAGTGGGGGLVCTGIRSNMACTGMGTCEGLACGLADLGTRSCTCAGTEGALWSCQSCVFPSGADAPGILLPPASGETIPTCESGIADGTTCDSAAAMGNPVTRCMNADAELCACWMIDGAPEYDCDDPPWD